MQWILKLGSKKQPPVGKLRHGVRASTGGPCPEHDRGSDTILGCSPKAKQSLGSSLGERGGGRPPPWCTRTPNFPIAALAMAAAPPTPEPLGTWWHFPGLSPAGSQRALTPCETILIPPNPPDD